MPTIVAEVASGLRLPYAAIELKRQEGFEVAAVHGVPTGEQTVLPLSYGGETVGRLVLARRRALIGRVGRGDGRLVVDDRVEVVDARGADLGAETADQAQVTAAFRRAIV